MPYGIPEILKLRNEGSQRSGISIIQPRGVKLKRSSRGQKDPALITRVIFPKKLMLIERNVSIPERSSKRQKESKPRGAVSEEPGSRGIAVSPLVSLRRARDLCILTSFGLSSEPDVSTREARGATAVPAAFEPLSSSSPVLSTREPSPGPGRASL